MGFARGNHISFAGSGVGRTCSMTRQAYQVYHSVSDAGATHSPKILSLRSGFGYVQCHHLFSYF